MNQAFVIAHPDLGIYLGSFWGLCFWSKLDPVGQPAAITSPSQEAEESAWQHGAPGGLRAGLPGWVDEITPVDNSVPV